jgi:hypothetical protein
VRDVQARAKTDLYYVTFKQSSDANADWRELAAAHDEVGEARNNLILVEAHRASIAELTARPNE